MQRRNVLLKFFLLGCVIALVNTNNSSAQNGITIDSIDIHWPRIDVHFRAECGGQSVFFNSGSAQDFLSLYEGETAVQDFTVACTDTGTFQSPVSSVVLLDHSNSMETFGKLETAKDISDLYFRSLDYSAGDESALIVFDHAYSLEQPMTSDVDSLRAALVSITPGGNTAMWDACIFALNTCSASSSNATRALVIITDGGDNRSFQFLQDAVLTALRNNIRVFPILVNSSYAYAEAQLRYLAEETGGMLYFHHDWPGYTGIFTDIKSRLTRYPIGCTLSYESACADGSRRTVKLNAVDLCPGSGDTLQFTVPRDETSFDKIYLNLTDDVAVGKANLEFRVDASMGPSGPRVVGPMRFDVRFNPSALIFQGMTTDSTIWDGAGVTATEYSLGVVTVLMPDPYYLYNGSLCRLKFTSSAPDSVFIDSLLLANILIQDGCDIGLMSTPGSYALLPKPSISHEGSLVRCVGDSIRLSATGGYYSYQWSSGEDTRTIKVYASGEYSVQCFPRPGAQPIQATVSVQFLERPIAPAILGDDSLCAYSSALYDIHEETGITYSWDVYGGTFSQQGDNQILVHWNKTDSAYVRLIATNGVCSDTSYLYVEIPPQPAADIVPSGPVFLCEGDTVTLEGPQGFASYQWSTGHTTRTIDVARTGTYFVKLVAPTGCPDTSDFVEVIVNPLPAKPVITFDSDVLESTPATSYQWYLGGVQIPGATGRTHHAAETGEYMVVITGPNGCASFETFTVTTLGMEGPLVPGTIDIYPTVVDNELTITVPPLNGTVSVALYTTLGVQVYQGFVEPGNTIKLTVRHIPTGLYMLHVETPRGAVETLIVKR